MNRKIYDIQHNNYTPRYTTEKARYRDVDIVQLCCLF